MKTPLLAALLLATTLAPLAEAAVYTPPVTSRCVWWLEDRIDDAGATVCVEWGGEGCIVHVSRETVYGREDHCVASWPGLP